MRNFVIEAIARADKCDLCISVEKVQYATSGDLSCLLMSINCARDVAWHVSHLAATNDQHFLIADLPGKNEGPSSLYLGK